MATRFKVGAGSGVGLAVRGCRLEASIGFAEGGSGIESCARFSDDGRSWRHDGRVQDLDSASSNKCMHQMVVAGTAFDELSLAARHAHR